MTKMPPVPPQNRSPKGVGSQNEERTEDPKLDRKENNAKQRQQGNIRQNTTHQGYHQARSTCDDLHESLCILRRGRLLIIVEIDEHVALPQVSTLRLHPPTVREF